MIKGSCLCGAVAFQIEGEPGPISHCHCHMCQKGHGAAYATYMNVYESDFAFTEGEALLSVYQSSEQTLRTFCSACGSNLQFKRIGKHRFGIAMGALDTEVNRHPDHEIWLASSSNWGTRDNIPTRHQTDQD